MTAFVFVFAAATVAILTVSLLGERGELSLIAIVRPALYAGVTMVVTMGLIAWLQAWAFVVVALVIVGSPALRSRLGRRIDPGPPPRDESRDETRDETRRRFDEIVAHELAGLDDDDRLDRRRSGVLRPPRTPRVSRATSTSSAAVTTTVRARAPSAVMSASPLASTWSASISTPRCPSRAAAAARRSGECSPMPPVNTSTSRPPALAVIAPISRTSRCT